MKINWFKIFDWSVVGVQRYSIPVAGNAIAYCVDVQYRHHGLRQVKFLVKDGGESENQLKKATEYFDKKCAQMHRDMKTR